MSVENLRESDCQSIVTAEGKCILPLFSSIAGRSGQCEGSEQVRWPGSAWRRVRLKTFSATFCHRLSPIVYPIPADC
jgi:hypothetical protein